MLEIHKSVERERKEEAGGAVFTCHFDNLTVFVSIIELHLEKSKGEGEREAVTVVDLPRISTKRRRKGTERKRCVSHRQRTRHAIL